MDTTPTVRLAATIIPARPSTDGFELLMVRRNRELSFGGLWTFPGGRLETIDGALPATLDERTQDWSDPELVATALAGARRETFEETSIEVATDAVWVSHWLPPTVGAPKRFATWFFAAMVLSDEVVLDVAENDRYQWLSPVAALAAHDSGELPLAVPTWVTLHDATSHSSSDALMSASKQDGPRWYHTRAFAGPESERVLCWKGDVAYESGALEEPGPRNRARVSPSFSVVERERSD